MVLFIFQPEDSKSQILNPKQIQNPKSKGYKYLLNVGIYVVINTNNTD